MARKTAGESSRGFLCSDAVQWCDRIPTFRRTMDNTYHVTTWHHNPEDLD